MTVTIPHYVQISPRSPLPDIAQFAPFKAILVIELDSASEWQDQVASWLAENGCRYAMTWGKDCEVWHDSIDHADMRARNFEDDDSKFIMTTWHAKESLESAFWFSQFCANFSYDDVELTNAVIVHIGREDRGSELLALFEQSETLADREDPEI